MMTPTILKLHVWHLDPKNHKVFTV